MSESVERSTERHHASITTADVKRDAAERFLRDDYRRALAGMLSGYHGAIDTPGYRRKSMLLHTNVAEQIDDDEARAMLAELIAIAYACAIDDDGVRARAVALITRLEDEHVSTHLDAAVGE